MTVKCKVLVAESHDFSHQAVDLLSAIADVQLADLNREELLSYVKDADVLWVRLRYRIDAEVLSAAPHLTCIVTPTTGLNHIDLEEAAQRDVQVLSLSGCVDFLKEIRATAEFTIALLLALLRNIPQAIHHVHEGGWNRDLFKGNELYGKTVGVVGYGRLGRIVAQYFCAFGMKVLATDPNATPSEIEPGVTLVSLDELLRKSDVVTIHVNLSTETALFFGRREFQAMKKSAWFVNTSRGELIDETALLSALETHHIRGAALDVLANEDAKGMSGHPLVAYAQLHDNLIITPHLGGCTSESMEKSESFLAKRLMALLEQQTEQREVVT